MGNQGFSQRGTNFVLSLPVHEKNKSSRSSSISKQTIQQVSSNEFLLNRQTYLGIQKMFRPRSSQYSVNWGLEN